VAISSVACAHASEQPFVPPLRAPEAEAEAARSPTEDAPFRLAAPPSLGDESLPHLSFELSTLDNGLRVLMVERHGFPSVATRLHVDTAVANAGDAGGWRAAILGAVFLSPATGVLRTSGGCGPVACTVTSLGTRDELAEVLGRIADLVYGESGPVDAQERRLAMTAVALEKGGGEGPMQVRRAARALVFGLGQLYGEPRALPPRPKLDELRSLRDRAFVPRASTLVVVGDFDRVEALAEIRKRFGAWADRPPVPGKAEPPPPPQDLRRMVHIQNAALTQTIGAIAARGPAPRDDDGLPFTLLARLLGGGPGSASYRHVREEMAASYNVRASLDPFPEASLLVFGGNFERSKALDGMNGIVNAIRAARDADIPEESLEEAKRSMIAGWRQAMSTNEGVAALLDEAILQGIPLERVQDFPARVRAVTRSQVRVVAQRYLNVPALRAIFVGRPNEVAGIDAPAFGAATLADGYGRPVPASRPAQEQ
jgi:predicted Zn-dependent peptidase